MSSAEYGSPTIQGTKRKIPSQVQKMDSLELNNTSAQGGQSRVPAEKQLAQVTGCTVFQPTADLSGEGEIMLQERSSPLTGRFLRVLIPTRRGSLAWFNFSVLLVHVCVAARQQFF